LVNLLKVARASTQRAAKENLRGTEPLFGSAVLAAILAGSPIKTAGILIEPLGSVAIVYFNTFHLSAKISF
jgi:uncharacterized MAPEG superfamily protein